MTGLDVLESNNFAELKGKRVGLITNHTGLDRSGAAISTLMLGAGVQVTTLYSPEHGITGAEDSNIDNSKDARSVFR